MKQILIVILLFSYPTFGTTQIWQTQMINGVQSQIWIPDTTVVSKVTQVQLNAAIAASEALDLDKSLTNELQDWSTLPGKPLTFQPSSHIHPVIDITGLHNVATTGNYNSLINTPTIPTIPFADRGVIFDGSNYSLYDTDPANIDWNLKQDKLYWNVDTPDGEFAIFRDNSILPGDVRFSVSRDLIRIGKELPIEIDGSIGNSGQVIKSRGTGNTPTWEDDSDAQILTINNQNLTISNGNTVSLPLNTYSAGSGINITGVEPNYTIASNNDKSSVSTNVGAPGGVIPVGATSYTSADGDHSTNVTLPSAAGRRNEILTLINNATLPYTVAVTNKFPSATVQMYTGKTLLLRSDGTNWQELNMDNQPPFRTVSTSYSATDSDYIINVNNIGAAVTITLPNAATRYRKTYTVKRDQNSTGTITVTSPGSILQGTTGVFAASVTLGTLTASGSWIMEWISDGINWHLLSKG